jgi:hypothetical protein
VNGARRGATLFLSALDSAQVVLTVQGALRADMATAPAPVVLAPALGPDDAPLYLTSVRELNFALVPDSFRY